MFRRLAAVAAALALCAGNLAVCAGWQPTPEARMACCTNGTHCPMHTSKGPHEGSSRAIGQAQADSCCAASSTRTQCSTSSPTFVLASVTVLPASSTPVVPPAVLALQEWRALVPLPVPTVPTHLRLSVLMV